MCKQAKKDNRNEMPLMRVKAKFKKKGEEGETGKVSNLPFMLRVVGMHRALGMDLSQLAIFTIGLVDTSPWVPMQWASATAPLFKK